MYLTLNLTHVAANEHQGSMKKPEKNANQIQGIYYRNITLINLVNCKRIKKRDLYNRLYSIKHVAT